MDNNFEYLLSEYRERIERLSNALMLGNCGSYEEYKYVVGQIRGLMAASNIVEDLSSTLETIDD